MKTAIILILLFILFSSIIPRQGRHNIFEVVSISGSTYAVNAKYHLAGTGNIADTVTVVLISDGEIISVNKYLCVESKTIKNK
jgi:hypothetical protein